ncbi:MAG: 5-(carboxyamino)imidazole ribonucleotide mutase [Nitrospiraceae bacterium]|nr:5-(carboxyamino)imidazole ribonucleotide mutase [Nitrospiraceae bacterium]|tara:strand:+ start:659 stop:1153 length:495 start_codon:yes stop_codon:yes gene_type:complete
MSNAQVAIFMGSKSDLPLMRETAELLKQFGVSYDMTITSAHRTPDRTEKLIKAFEANGGEVFIAGAGSAAHLAGVIAARTILPVIGVPIASSPLQGWDALLATVQMPKGVPVATMAMGKAGAKNAGVFAAQIIARKDPKLAKQLIAYKEEMEKTVIADAEQMET